MRHRRGLWQFIVLVSLIGLSFSRQGEPCVIIPAEASEKRTTPASNWYGGQQSTARPPVSLPHVHELVQTSPLPPPGQVDLAYLLSIDDPSSGQATVTMTVRGLSTDQLQIEEHGYHGLYVSVLSLSAWDSTGEPLSVQHVPDSGTTYFEQQADVWQIQCAGESQITVAYAVRPGLVDSEYEHRGYIAPDFALLAGDYVFLVPRSCAVGSVSVAFDLPSGWEAYTPWTWHDGTYDPTIAEAYVLDSLTVSVFALGQFDIYTQNVGSTVADVAAYRDWPGELKEELAGRSWEILKYQTSVFGGSVGEYYLALFCPMAPDGKRVYGGEWSTSQGYSIPWDGSSWGGWDMFAHQVFHRWNGWAWGMSGYYSWFGEGPNVFYEMKTITELRISRPYGDMEDELRRYYDTYVDEYLGTGRDQPLASSGPDSFLVYRKGAMVAFLMAREIYSRTDGAHKFDDLLEQLVSKYGHYNGSCSEECLKAELALLTGSDFAQFFDDYVYGTTPLPMDWAFEDSDGDELSNALEIGWDTHPGRPDTDGDGYNDAVEVSAHTDPLDPFSIPYLAYIPVVDRNYTKPMLPFTIDGHRDDWEPYQPCASDPPGDTSGGPHTDLKAVFLQRGPNYVYVMVEPYGPPLLSEAVIELNVDVVGSAGTWELHTNITPAGELYAWTYRDPDGALQEYPISGESVAWGNVMELRVPLYRLGNPSQISLSYVNFWCEVGGEWIWVDVIQP